MLFDMFASIHLLVGIPRASFILLVYVYPPLVFSFASLVFFFWGGGQDLIFIFSNIVVRYFFFTASVPNSDSSRYSSSQGLESGIEASSSSKIGNLFASFGRKALRFMTGGPETPSIRTNQDREMNGHPLLPSDVNSFAGSRDGEYRGETDQASSWGTMFTFLDV